jgi:hypothetical protein
VGDYWLIQPSSHFGQEDTDFDEDLRRLCAKAIDGTRAYDTNSVWAKASLSGYVTALAGLLLHLTTSLTGLDCRTEWNLGIKGNAANVLGSLFFMTGNSHVMVSPINTSHIKRLATSGQNLELLALPFPQLAELEINFITKFHSRWHNKIYLDTSFLPVPRPYLDVLRILTDWEGIAYHQIGVRYTSDLLALLQCKSIKTVEHRIARSPNKKLLLYGSWGVGLSDFQPVSHTVKNLVLSCSENSSLGLFDSADTFLNFTNLETLRLPCQALFSHSKLCLYPDLQPRELAKALPMSLKKLTVLLPDKDMIVWMEKLIEAKRRTESSICYVHLLCSDRYYASAEWFRSQTDLVQKALEVGIVVEISCLPEEY